MRIARLDPVTDRAAVASLLSEAQDYFHLWKGRAPGADEVEEIFTAAPPNCDPAVSQRLGLYLNGTLSGVAELSFGFPEPEDAYLGLMILAPRARSAGHGAAFLADIEARARSTGANTLYLGVLEANPRGRAFWGRMGFAPTGVMRESHEDGVSHRVHRLKKPL